MTDPFLSDEARDPSLAGRVRRRFGDRSAQGVVVAALVVLVAGVTAAVVVSARSPTPKVTTGALPPAGRLADRLLAASDLPAGWSLFESVNDPAVGKDAFGGASPLVPGCLTGDADRGRLAEAEVELVDGAADVPVLAEAVAELPAEQAPGTFAAVARQLSSCSQLWTVAGRVTAVSFPPIAEQSAAWQVTLGATVTTESAVIVVVRQGNDVVVVEYGSYGAPQVAGVVLFASTAVAKLG